MTRYGGERQQAGETRRSWCIAGAKEVSAYIKLKKDGVARISGVIVEQARGRLNKKKKKKRNKLQTHRTPCEWWCVGMVVNGTWVGKQVCSPGPAGGRDRWQQVRRGIGGAHN